MPRSPSRTADIRALTKQALTDILSFNVTYDVAQYQQEKHLRDWRDFEDELHVEYPIRGKCFRIQREVGRQQDLPIELVPLAPERVTSDFERYPYAQTGATFVFTLLELYGDDLAAMIGPKNLPSRTSWHRGIRGGLEASQLNAFRAELAKPFGFDPAAVGESPIAALSSLKEARNEFVHTGRSHIDFDSFVERTIMVIAHLHFLAIPTDQVIPIHPWEDYDGLWSDAW